MLHVAETYLRWPEEKLIMWCSILPVVFMLVNIFSPVISLMTFRLNFDEHLVECQQYRRHSENCQASCILEEIMAEQSEAIPDKTIFFTHFYPDLFFHNHHLISTATLNTILKADIFCHYLLLYSPPLLGMLSPPPK